MNTAEPFDLAWLRTVAKVSSEGRQSSPRGQSTLELVHHTVSVDLRFPVLRTPERRLNYRFMAAEALWILRGSSRLDELTPYNPHMAEFSDDGKTLAGAYGPRIMSQLGNVVDFIVRDPETRRATLTVWTPNPLPTKDYPCTVAMDFKLRDGRLDSHVFMRSNDVWLGLPYDVFSFACVNYLVVNALRREGVCGGDVRPGTLHLTASSSHLYLGKDYSDQAEQVVYNVEDLSSWSVSHPAKHVPESMWSDGPYSLKGALSDLRDTKRGDPRRVVGGRDVRIGRDDWAMSLAAVTAMRSTCLRRAVGCVLTDARGRVLATGYNGVARGRPHCNHEAFRPTHDAKVMAGLQLPSSGGGLTYHPFACAGASSPSGTSLDACGAVHAESNALAQCRDVDLIEACYVTVTPCVSCLKSLLNTGCRRIVAGALYAASDMSLWTEDPGRTWSVLDLGDRITSYFTRGRTP